MSEFVAKRRHCSRVKATSRSGEEIGEDFAGLLRVLGRLIAFLTVAFCVCISISLFLAADCTANSVPGLLENSNSWDNRASR